MILKILKNQNLLKNKSMMQKIHNFNQIPSNKSKNNKSPCNQVNNTNLVNKINNLTKT